MRSPCLGTVVGPSLASLPMASWLIVAPFHVDAPLVARQRPRQSRPRRTAAHAGPVPGQVIGRGDGYRVRVRRQASAQIPPGPDLRNCVVATIIPGK